MYSKKLTAALVAVGVVASTIALFNEINIKDAFADTVKQDVVYTKNDTSAVSKDNITVTDAEKEAYKNKSLETLKKYFNISVEENENFEYHAEISNEKTSVESNNQDIKDIKELYDNKKISKEEYDEQIAERISISNFQKEKFAQLKHGMIVTGWIPKEGHGYKNYFVEFNENTKEVEDVVVNEGDPTKETENAFLKISEDQLKNTAEDFLKKYKLGNIEKPKCILVKGYYVFYQDENDSTKKVKIGIDGFTGKVNSFSINSSAEWDYNRFAKK